MSVPVRMHQDGEGVRPSRYVVAIARVVLVLERICLFVVAICAVAVAAGLLQGPSAYAGSVAFAQWGVCLALHYAMLREISRILSDVIDLRCIQPEHSKRMKRIALCFAGIALCGIAFSVVAVLGSEQPFSLSFVAAAPAGFPPVDAWYEVFSIQERAVSSLTVAIDIPSLVAAAIVWCLAYVFDYAAELQSENTMTF